jgi:dTDP-4-amino-4,6-dideoxygalactose transaminase
VPHLGAGARSAWAQYTITVAERDRVAARLGEAGIPTAVYYPIPLNRQQAYRAYPVGPGGVPVSERLSQQVLSLPMHPYLEPAAQDRIVTAVIAAVRQG